MNDSGHLASLGLPYACYFGGCNNKAIVCFCEWNIENNIFNIETKSGKMF